MGAALRCCRLSAPLRCCETQSQSNNVISIRYTPNVEINEHFSGDVVGQQDTTTVNIFSAENVHIVQHDPRFSNSDLVDGADFTWKQIIDEKVKTLEDDVRKLTEQMAGRNCYFNLRGKRKQALDRLWTDLKKSRLSQLMKRLYNTFEVKLLAIRVHRSMRFTLNIPPDKVTLLDGIELDIREAILKEIITKESTELKKEIEWERMVWSEKELSVPVQETDQGGASPYDTIATDPQTQERLLTFDPVTAIPKRSFEVQTGTGRAGDYYCASSLVITASQLIVLADLKNKQVLCIPLDTPHDVINTRLNNEPWDLTVYEQDVIAVATNTDSIYFLKVERKNVDTIREINTERKYCSVTSFGDDDSLVVGSHEDDMRPAVIDVISGKGNVLWRVVDDFTLLDLKQPTSLHHMNHQVLVADRGSHCIHRVGVDLGTVYPAMTHPDLKDPHQVTTDAGGNVYVACGVMRCVMMHSRTSEQWRPLLKPPQHVEEEPDIPLAVGVSDDGVLVVACRNSCLNKSVVTGYSM